MKKHLARLIALAILMVQVAVVSEPAHANLPPIQNSSTQFYRLIERAKVGTDANGQTVVLARDAQWQLVDTNIGIVASGPLPSGTSANSANDDESYIGDCHVDRSSGSPDFRDTYPTFELGESLSDAFGSENVFVNYRYRFWKELRERTVNWNGVSTEMDYTIGCSEGGASAMSGVYRLKRTGTIIASDLPSNEVAIVARDWANDTDASGKVVRVGYTLSGGVSTGAQSGAGATLGSSYSFGTDWVVQPPSGTKGGEGPTPPPSISLGNGQDQVWDEWAAGCGLVGTCGVDGEYRGASLSLIFEHKTTADALPPTWIGTYVEVSCASQCDPEPPHTH